MAKQNKNINDIEKDLLKLPKEHLIKIIKNFATSEVNKVGGNFIEGLGVRVASDTSSLEDVYIVFNELIDKHKKIITRDIIEDECDKAEYVG